MSRWYRVFSTNYAQTEAAALLTAQARGSGVEVRGKFQVDDYGWYEADLVAGHVELWIGRFLVREDNLRTDLNSWVAWLEEGEAEPNVAELIQHVNRTAQMYTLQCTSGDTGPDADFIEELCVGFCQFLARATGGVYQVDGKGFFDAEGMLLVGEGVDEEDEDAEDGT